MEKIKSVLAKNLTKLRIKNNLTQTELAEKLNYTDKSISKWEHGDATPPIEILVEIAEIYGVTLDDLVSEEIDETYDKIYSGKQNTTNKIIITSLAVLIVWFLATISFIYSNFILFDKNHPWNIFILAVPVSSIVLLIFNLIWGKRKYIFIIVSFLLWGFIAYIYFKNLEYNFWPLFIAGFPLQVAIILWSQLKPNKSKRNRLH